jgi:hypothetical protein
MGRLLGLAANQLQETGTVSPLLVARIKKYDASHAMWLCLADDSMRDTWQAMQGLGLI